MPATPATGNVRFVAPRGQGSDESQDKAGKLMLLVAPDRQRWADHDSHGMSVGLDGIWEGSYRPNPHALCTNDFSEQVLPKNQNPC